MEPIKLNLVNDIDLLLNRGDAMICVGKEDRLQLVIVCPGCGKVSGSAGNHVYNPETKTYYPSIVHNTGLGGCGWHGLLKDGVFIEC
jgi:hypothetical protein